MNVFISFIGRLGMDAETVTTGEVPFISFRVAVDEMSRKGQQTRWITVHGSHDRFKNVVTHLTKGRLVSVRGTETVSLYTTKGGEAAIDTRVWADAIDFIPTGQRQNDDASAPTPKPNNSPSPTPVTGAPAPPVVAEMSPDDDLPF